MNEIFVEQKTEPIGNAPIGSVFEPLKSGGKTVMFSFIQTRCWCLFGVLFVWLLSPIEIVAEENARLLARMGDSSRNLRHGIGKIAFSNDSMRFLTLSGPHWSDLAIWKVDHEGANRLHHVLQVTPGVPIIAAVMGSASDVFWCVDLGGAIFRGSAKSGAVHQIAFLETAHFVAADSNGQLAVSCWDGRVHFLDGDTGRVSDCSPRVLRSIRGERLPIGKLFFLSAARLVAGIVEDQHKFAVWRTDDGELVRLVDNAVSGHLSQLVSSPDGKTLVSISRLRQTNRTERHRAEIQVWSLPEVKLLRSIETGDELFESGAGGILDDNSTLVCPFLGKVVRWNLVTGEQLGETTVFDARSRPGSSAAVSPNGSLVVGFDDHRLSLWNTRTGERLGSRLPGHRSRVVHVSRDDSTKTVVSQSFDGGICQWDASTGKAVEHDEAAFERSLFARCPASRSLIVGQALNRPNIQVPTKIVWEVREAATFKPVRQFETTEEAMPLRMVASRDGHLIAVSTRSKLHPVERILIRETTTGVCLNELAIKDVDWASLATTFSNDSSRLYAITQQGRGVEFDLSTGEMAQNTTVLEHVPTPNRITSRAWSAAFSNNGEFAVVGIGRFIGVYDLPGFKLRQTIELDDIGDLSHLLALSSDAKWLVISDGQSADCPTTDRVTLWHVPDARKVAEWHSENTRPNCIQISDDDCAVILGMDNSTIELWALPTEPK